MIHPQFRRPMRAALKPFLLTLVVLVSTPLFVDTQEATDSQQMGTAGGPRQMRPVLRGRDYAVSSMKAEATAAAVRFLEAGGNAFDAIVAGQAVLALVDFDSNGFEIGRA